MKCPDDEILKKEGIGRMCETLGEDFFYLDITELWHRVQQNPRLISKMNYDSGEQFEQVLIKRYKARKDGQEMILKLVDWRPEK